MVPIPMSVCPFFIAVIDVISSGSDVPMATMVIPAIVLIAFLRSGIIPRPAGIGLAIAYAVYLGYTLLL